MRGPCPKAKAAHLVPHVCRLGSMPYNDRMTRQTIHIAYTSSPEETKRCARLLAHALCAGDVAVLSGDLGAGKTQFVQGIAAGLGIDAPVTSPTFNLLLGYVGGRLPLFHLDLYRLEDASELEDIGFYEVVDGDGATFIEWGEKFPGELPEDRLEIFISGNTDAPRHIEARAFGKHAGEVLENWAKAVSEGEGA